VCRCSRAETSPVRWLTHRSLRLVSLTGNAVPELLCSRTSICGRYPMTIDESSIDRHCKARFTRTAFSNRPLTRHRHHSSPDGEGCQRHLQSPRSRTMDNSHGLCLIMCSPVQWMHFMRSVVCFLVLCLASATAVAQPPRSAEEIKAIDERVDFWRTTCLGDWDAATHMTRAQWRTTCERVAAERRQFLLQDPASFTIGKSRQR
jgi:hypothetical protein